MKLDACVLLVALMAGSMSLPAGAQELPPGFSLGHYETEGAVNRVDAAGSTVWIAGKAYRVTAQTRIYSGNHGDLKAVGRLADVPLGGTAGFQLNENGTLETLWFRPKETR
ncbi:MAG: hypothetical protein KF909_04475 [Rhodocyclaceae bacterium]|nr:hypothetical protein [Rhodocyclaceae bacterium]MCP5232120.1 hypothetical protein [Zoogloeaceae bacterium]MCB1912089.1 hypothetical protein [Rhodocyclaceae bacterium]MCP5238490.1 hypothetical protein [Zoogloeaceae bacterium]MCP5254596.1 hypothetical protein [Zoogloeaceae bacterium]